MSYLEAAGAGGAERTAGSFSTHAHRLLTQDSCGAEPSGSLPHPGQRARGGHARGLMVEQGFPELQPRRR